MRHLLRRGEDSVNDTSKMSFGFLFPHMFCPLPFTTPLLHSPFTPHTLRPRVTAPITKSASYLLFFTLILVIFNSFSLVSCIFLNLSCIWQLEPVLIFKQLLLVTLPCFISLN